MYEQGFIEGKQSGVEYFVENDEGKVFSKTLDQIDTGKISLFVFEKVKAIREVVARYDSAAYLLSGKIKACTGFEEKQIKAGGMVLLPANIPHSFYGNDFFEMLLVMNKGAH